jgi:hypothetical protein
MKRTRNGELKDEYRLREQGTGIEQMNVEQLNKERGTGCGMQVNIFGNNK